MDREDRFPPEHYYLWRPFAMQNCEECGAIIDHALREVHHDWHEMIARATATS
jgi:hypothetical protein